MQTLPQHPRRRNNDPQLPKGRKKLVPTLFASALAIFLVTFAKGDLPQVDAFFNNLNEIFHSHNDEAVQAVIHYGPEVLLLVGILGVAMLLRSSFRSRRKSA